MKVHPRPWNFCINYAEHFVKSPGQEVYGYVLGRIAERPDKLRTGTVLWGTWIEKLTRHWPMPFWLVFGTCMWQCFHALVADKRLINVWIWALFIKHFGTLKTWATGMTWARSSWTVTTSEAQRSQAVIRTLMPPPQFYVSAVVTSQLWHRHPHLKLSILLSGRHDNQAVTGKLATWLTWLTWSTWS